MAKDTSKISNAAYEINAASKSLKVSPLIIHIAKHETKSNDRETIYKWVNENRGGSFFIQIL